MNDFAVELEALIEKHREFPGADLKEMARVLINAGAGLRVDAENMGPFAPQEA